MEYVQQHSMYRAVYTVLRFNNMFRFVVLITMMMPVILDAVEEGSTCQADFT